MKNLKQGLLFASLIVSQPLWACTEDGVKGFLPENDLRISVSEKRSGGLTEKQFNDAIDSVEKLYSPIITAAGATLVIERKWDDATVNAYAQRSGTTWKVSMFGGLARHETITSDGMALVVCHELGHHLGGAPKKASYWASSWASNEGQADYFATLKCLRRAWLSEDNAAAVSAMEVPQALTNGCTAQWSTKADRDICIRGGMAGDSVAKLFAALRTQAPAKFETPDSAVVAETDDNHPAHQCRLDTYFQGALCAISYVDNVSDTSEVTSTCHGSTGHKIGLRPLCWFKPSVQ
jgi:hypothetical protein